MRFSLCRSSSLRVVATLTVLSAAMVSVALARPRPGTKAGPFRLFSSAVEFIGTNRVQCNVFASGQLCYAGSSTAGAGFWPKGSADQYNFAGGLQIAGVVDNALPKSSNAFSGDTAGAFFYNTGFTSNGLAVRPIFSSQDAGDVAAWPDEARVPQGDATENLFDPTLRGQITASQGDRWWLSWEGDPSDLAGGRAHPLGIAVETRFMAWNFPSGNQDIIYYVFTFYNVTSSQDAPYANIRESLRPTIANQGKIFQALNSAKFGPIPDEGYTIKNLFVDVVQDADVADYNRNFSGVNLPFNLGYAYQADFSEASARSRGWTFDPAIFGSAPFFNGPGFFGVKYLLSPTNPATGKEVGLSQFNVFTNGGTLSDPSDDKQLYRYMTGNLLSSDGSGCNAPPNSKICAIDLSTPTDVRFLEASGPFDLAPGQAASIVVAYIYAAPVQDGACPGPSCLVPPADAGNAARLTILGDPARMGPTTAAVNQIDRMTGYNGFSNGGPGDTDPTKVTQEEFRVRPGSLLDKSLVAQTVFNNKFLLPFAPERPPFFLVPGDNQVTIIWSKSPTETVPDPFFAIASQPLNADGTNNALYDPNFRGLDVEGYRVYRGRASNPSELTLIAQFDYPPDPFSGRGHFFDFKGVVNPTPQCAPELGVTLVCPAAFTVPTAPAPYTVSADVDLFGTVTQVVTKAYGTGDRVLLASGTAQILPGKLDTAFTDIGRGKIAVGVSTDLKNNGVPFLFIDHNVRNSLRYFYAVTAFDVNSVASGPSSLESSRVAKPVTPVRTPNNLASSSSAVGAVLDRDGTPLTNTTDPTLDATTGEFSGPFPPADPAAAVLGFASLVPEVVNGTSSTFSARLDSIQLGEASDDNIFGTTFPSPHTYWYTAKPGTPDANVFSVPVFQNGGGSGVGGIATDSAGVGFFDGAADVTAANSNKFEGAGGAFKLSGSVTQTLPASTYTSNYGVGCNFGDPGFTAGACSYNGARWFDGPSPTKNETKADPNAGNMLLAAAPLPDYNNAGQLTGVSVIYEPHAYLSFGNSWRNMDWILGGAARAADFNVYWGTGGKVDSVVDVTHNVIVPFLPTIGGNWGILTEANSTGANAFDGRTDALTVTDITCVEPFKSSLPGARARIPCDTLAAVPAYKLDSIATLGTIAFNSVQAATAKDPALSPPAPQPGFLFYLSGHVFLMQMAALPAPGTVWSMRSYIGAISGGNGSDGSEGPYAFRPALRSFTAVGAQAQVTLSASIATNAVTKNDLSRVHTVPDPYYVQSKYEVSTDLKVLKFVGLPQDCIIRIYSVSGVLVRIIEHHAANYSSTSFGQGSEHDWDLRNRNNQVVASGVYFWHVEAGDARKVGRFTVVNFAQ